MQDDKLIEIEKALVPFLSEIETFTISDDQARDNAIEFLGQIKIRFKRIDFLRKEKVDPLNQEVKIINNNYKIWLDKLDKASKILNNGIVKYLEELERKAQLEAARVRKEQEEQQRIEDERIAKLREEEAKLLKEAESAKTEQERSDLQWQADTKHDEALKVEEQAAAVEVQVVEEAPRTVRSSSGTFSLKKVWEWEVIDHQLLLETHPELFMVNDKAVSKMVQSGEREIAGIRIYQASQGSMRT